MKSDLYRLDRIVVILIIGMFLAGIAYGQDDDTTRNVLKQGLLGAGTGAIASGASGGNAGKGALIGAGTAVIGSALLDAVTSPPRSRRAAPPQDEYYYPAPRARAAASAPVRQRQQQQVDDYYADEPEEYYEEPPQESGSAKVLKQGLVGAGTGAIAAGTSGGNAGQGALIGAGTAVVGSALLDAMTQPSQQKRRVYRRVPKQVAAPAPSQNIKVQEEAVGSEGSRKKIIKKYDDTGKLVSEEEIYY